MLNFLVLPKISSIGGSKILKKESDLAGSLFKLHISLIFDGAGKSIPFLKERKIRLISVLNRIEKRGVRSAAGEADQLALDLGYRNNNLIFEKRGPNLFFYIFKQIGIANERRFTICVFNLLSKISLLIVVIGTNWFNF